MRGRSSEPWRRSACQKLSGRPGDHDLDILPTILRKVYRSLMWNRLVHARARTHTHTTVFNQLEQIVMFSHCKSSTPVSADIICARL